MNLLPVVNLLSAVSLVREGPLGRTWKVNDAIYLPFLSWCLCRSLPSSWQKVVHAPPISWCFCRSVRVRGRWNTPKLGCCFAHLPEVKKFTCFVLYDLLKIAKNCPTLAMYLKADYNWLESGENWLNVPRVRQGKRAQRLTFWVWRPPGGVGVFTRRGGGRKVRARPRKFVCLGFRRQESGMSRDFCRDVPDPWRCSKVSAKEVRAHFSFPKEKEWKKEKVALKISHGRSGKTTPNHTYHSNF